MSSPPASGRKRRLSSDPGSRWASLPEDLIGVVASRLLLAGDLLDYVRFRAVCTTWRSGTDDPRGRGVADPRFHPRRWMMLPDGHYLYPGHPKLGGCVRFHQPRHGGLGPLPDPAPSRGLPLRYGLHRRPPPPAGKPGLGRRRSLPPPLHRRHRRLPAHRDPGLTLARHLHCNVEEQKAHKIRLRFCFHRRGRSHHRQVSHIAFATSLDREWTLSALEFPPCYYRLPFQGKLYVVVDTPTPLVWDQEKIHHVLQVDPPVTLEDGTRALPEPKLIATIPGHKLLHPDGLVECGSELLLLGHNDMSWSQIVIFKLADLVLQRFIPIQSIGGNTLFLGGRSISVSSRVLPTAKGDNVVYYNSSEPPYLAQYNLTTGTLSPAIDTCSLYGRAPGPSNLVHYIFSCCNRDNWSKGLIFRKEWTRVDMLA